MIVTIDFWQTLYDSSGGEERNAERRSAMYEAICAENPAPDPDLFEKVYLGLWDYFDTHWFGSQRTPTSEEMVSEVLGALGARLSAPGTAEVVRVFEEGILNHPPQLLPGVREGLAFLSAHAPLSLISDTAFSPGRILRRLMERDGILDHFSNLIFSDETGVAKPHPEAFRRAIEPLGGRPDDAVHIGDIERTDIAGAKGIGMRAILYRSAEHLSRYAENVTSADEVMTTWRAVGELEAFREWEA